MVYDKRIVWSMGDIIAIGLPITSNLEYNNKEKNNSPIMNSYVYLFFILSLRVQHKIRIYRLCFSVMVNRNNDAVVSWESERYKTVTLRGV